MRPSVNLLFGVHNHQPVGNFERVFQKAASDCYRPFIETLYKWPEIKATLHFSGSLIDWLLKNDPGLLERVKEMVKRHQVEILTGGYFEPILPIIPEQDRLGQINMLSNFIRDFFGCEPQGMWIGERVWEPHLVKSIVAAGIKYVLLDDFHFLNAGIKKVNLSGYYLSEEEGLKLAVFPISKKLRYLIPFSQPRQPLAYLKSLATDEGNAAATIVDDGEKFGLWPGTHKWVYQRKWLEKFFRLLIENRDWLKTLTISEYMSRYKPQGRYHLPAASYEEMMSWSGGSFTNFFLKYPEANNLHKRMLYVSEKLNQQKQDNQEARKYLYMGQSNCPYWHGVFGGIYLRHLRHAAYKNLITAQSLIEKKKESRWIETETFDFDQDGACELIVKNPSLNVFITPKLGGGIFEFDYIPKGINLLDVMSRRPEAYHGKIKGKGKRQFGQKKGKITSIHDLLVSKEKGLGKLLIYDSYRRLAFLDHFFNSRYEELGDFISAPYLFKQKKEEGGISIILEREGKIDYNGKAMPVKISKRLIFNEKDAQVVCEYTLQNLSSSPLDIVFGVEFNISLSEPEEPNVLRCTGETAQESYSLKESTKTKGIKELCLEDVYSGIKTTLQFAQRADLWSYPLETISASESGFERNYQQTVILPYWPVNLKDTWQTKLILAVT